MNSPSLPFRIACAASETKGAGHSHHRYELSDRDKAFEHAAKNNGQHTDPPEWLELDPRCFPWRVEARVIGPWGDPLDVEEQAHYLAEEIADQERVKAESAHLSNKETA